MSYLNLNVFNSNNCPATFNTITPTKKTLKACYVVISDPMTIMADMKTIFTMLNRANISAEACGQWIAIMIESCVISELSDAPIQKPEKKQRIPKVPTSLHRTIRL